MEDLLTWAEENYSLVVVDSPPAGVVADAIPVARMVSAVVLVTRVGVTDRAATGRLHGRLRQFGTRVVGVVANGVSPDAAEAYGYASSYARR
jgi:tyrosine-protein kinase Etk/Wzc